LLGGPIPWLRILSRGGACASLGLLLLLTAAGCVEPFGGSDIEFALAGSVQVPGLPSEFGRPPPGTHYEYHAFENVTDTDGDGNEIVVATYSVKVADFEVRPLVDQASPCYIEDEESKFPGLHSTQYLRKLQEVTGVDDPFFPPADASPGDVIDVLTAQRRMEGIALLANGIKAITSHDPAPYPSGIPAADLIDDASNRQRKQMCEDFWRDHPLKYEGNDLVFTLPLNGKWYGAVDGADPRNGVFLGGAHFFVDTDLSNLDGLLLNWQYNCTGADFQENGIQCTPDWPDGLPADEQSPIGFHYMSGAAVTRTRGVINVPMKNRLFSRLTGEAAIWVDLDSDDVQF